MPVLSLYPSREAVEAAWQARLEEGGIVELGSELLSAEALVLAAAGSVATLGRLGERLLVESLLGQRGPFAALHGGRGLGRSLLRHFASLGRLGITPERLADAAARLGGGVAELAGAYASYRRRLDAAGLVDEAGRWRRGCEAIARGERVAALEEVETVELHHVYEAAPASLQLIDALLARGLTVRVLLPGGEGLPPSVAAGLAPLEAALEARHAALRLERQEEPLSAPRHECTLAPSAAAEARQVAASVRALLDEGVAPERIRVVAESPARRARLEAALRRFGVPLAVRRPPPLTDAPPLRLLGELLRLVAAPIARDRFIEVLSSRYVAGEVRGENGVVWPYEIAAALRAAGCVEGSHFGERLGAWARDPRTMALGGRAEAICRQVDHWLELLGSWPVEATLERHARHLGRLLERLDFFGRTRALPAMAPWSDEVGRLVGRDQAAARALAALLVELPRLARRLGLGGGRLERARFVQLVFELLDGQGGHGHGARGAAVELTDLHGLVGRPAAHLFVSGCVDGEVPPRPPEETLLLDEERQALEGRLGALLPRAQLAAEGALVGLYVALARAERAQLSYAEMGDTGATTLPTPLWLELEPAAVRRQRVPRGPIPALASAQTSDEIWARVWLDRGRGLGGALEPLRRRDGERAERIAALVASATWQRRFFDGSVEADERVGRLTDPALLEALAAARLPGSPARPLSATLLERYSLCPFRFFAESCLGLRVAEEADDEVDPRHLGQLMHRVLERFYSRLRDERRLPLVADAAQLELLEEVCDDAIADYTRPLGHPALFEVAAEKLRRNLAELVRCEAENEPLARARPTEFERHFGPLAVGGVWVSGSIDRIDLDGEAALVLDYKRKLRPLLEDVARPELLCVRHWQLPLYARVVELERQGPVTAYAYGIEEPGLSRPPVTAPVDFDERLAALYAKMRAGRFEIAPAEEACQRCQFAALCRVRRLRRDEELA